MEKALKMYIERLKGRLEQFNPYKPYDEYGGGKYDAYDTVVEELEEILEENHVASD